MVMALSGDSFKTLKPQNIDFKVTGIFKTGYYEYDRNLAIMSLESVPILQSGPADLKLGIKLNNLYRDKAIVDRLSTITGAQAVSWRDYNKAFFGALRMEKYAMMFLICLIFVVIGVNIYNFMRRSVSEKIEDIAVLYSLGVREQDMRRIFITEGAFVGLLGGTLGVLLAWTGVRKAFRRPVQLRGCAVPAVLSGLFLHPGGAGPGHVQRSYVCILLCVLCGAGICLSGSEKAGCQESGISLEV